MIAFLWKVPNLQICRDESRSMVAGGGGRGLGSDC